MNLFIPEIGTKLTLTAPLHAPVEWERRNGTLIKHFYPQLFEQQTALEENYRHRAWHMGWRDGFDAVKAPANMRSDMSPKNPWALKASQWLDAQRNAAHDALKNFIATNPIVHQFSAGTILEVDRIYIRKGAEKYSSLTFKVRLHRRTVRFWIPLSEVNKIECVIV